MKTKANVLRLEEPEDEDLNEALLSLIKKQLELDKKLKALLVVTITGE